MLRQRAAKGGVLIIVLILSLTLMVITTAAVQEGILQIKMVNHFQENIKIRQALEEKLIFWEKQLGNGLVDLPPHIKLIQYVPDLLNGKQGIYYYRIKIIDERYPEKSVTSTFAVRKLDLSLDLNDIVMEDQVTAHLPPEKGGLERLGRRTWQENE